MKEMSEFYTSIKAGLEEAIAHKQGKETGARVNRIAVETPDVAAIRAKLHMTQPAFSAAFDIPLATLRKWEQGQRVPHGPARALLKIIERKPQMALEALEAAE